MSRQRGGVYINVELQIVIRQINNENGVSMRHQIKSIVRKILPEKVRSVLYGAIPHIRRVNTYILKRDILIKDLHQIDSRYLIKQIGMDDREKLQKAYSYRSAKYFVRRGLPRLKNPAWVGLAAIDTTNSDIAYIAWIVKENMQFNLDYGIIMKQNQFFLKDDFCIPHYRHQGIHTRMNQERINYCINNGANEMFVQIWHRNKKGISFVLNNGFTLYQKNLLLFMEKYGIYRELFSALKAPFQKRKSRKNQIYVKVTNVL